MEFARLHKKNFASIYYIFGTIYEESSLSFHEIVKFVLARAVGVVATVPGEPLAAYEPVDVDSVLNLHKIRMSITDMICQYLALCFLKITHRLK